MLSLIIANITINKGMGKAEAGVDPEFLLLKLSP